MQLERIARRDGPRDDRPPEAAPLRRVAADRANTPASALLTDTSTPSVAPLPDGADGSPAAGRIRRLPTSPAGLAAPHRPPLRVLRRNTDPVIRRALVVPVNGPDFVDATLPTRDEVLAWRTNYARPEIVRMIERIESLPEGAGAGDAAKMKEAFNDFAKIANRSKTYDAATTRAALNTLVREANALELGANEELVPWNTNLTTSPKATEHLQKLTKRHDEVKEMIYSLGPVVGPAMLLTPQGVAATNARAAAVTACDPAGFNAVGARTALQNFASATGALQNLAQPEMQASVDSTMKFGTELTFTHPVLHNLDPKEPTKDPDGWNAAIAFIKAWETLVMETGLGFEPEVHPVVTRDPITEGGHGADRTVPRFTYTFGDPARTWWWRLNVDPGCLEMQTDPMTKVAATEEWTDDSAQRMINTIISTHIFGIAPKVKKTEVGLARHAEIGGGHLTLDSATTFYDNARFFRNLLVLYANQADRWIPEDIDRFNAPTISELVPAGRKAFVRVIGEFDKAYTTSKPQDIKTLTEALIGQVFIDKYHDPDEGTEAMRKKRAFHPKHYQATNVEHMAKENPRLEMRRFDSQTSVDDLLDNMGKLTKLVVESRKPGLVPVTVK